jgi:hypothetical protein
MVGVLEWFILFKLATTAVKLKVAKDTGMYQRVKLEVGKKIAYLNKHSVSQQS